MNTNGSVRCRAMARAAKEKRARALQTGMSALTLAAALCAPPARAQFVDIATTGNVISGSGGTINGSAQASPWNVGGGLLVGDAAAGSLSIESGGMVNNGTGGIGDGAVTVTGVGSTWTNTGTLIVGYASGRTGSLRIENGATVSNGTGYVASGGSGTVVVASGGTWTNTASLSVGDTGGTGDLNIESGGTVSSNGTGNIGRTSTGIVTVTDGGTWTNTGELRLGFLAAGSGTLNIGKDDLSGTAGTVTATRLTGGAGSATVNFNQTDDITFAVPIEGSINVNQRGSGTTTLTGTNTYAGGTTITGGFINFSTGGNLGTGNVTLNGGGLQWAAGNTTDISGRLNALGAGGGTFDTNGNDVVFATAVTGTGGLTKSGTGTLTLTGGGSYGGATAVNNGTLIVDGGDIQSANGYLSVTNTGGGNAAFTVRNGAEVVLDAVGGTSRVGAGGEGSLTVTGAGSTLRLAGNLNIGQTNASGDGTLTVADGGKLVSLNGGIGVDGATGQVTVTGNNSLWDLGQTGGHRITLGGDGGSGALTLADGGRVSADEVHLTGNAGSPGAGILHLDGSAGARGVLETDFVEAGFGGTRVGGSTANVAFDGGILRATADTADFLRGFNAGEVTIANGGAFVDSNGHAIGIGVGLAGTGGLTKAGAGTLTLTGASTYTGATTVASGILAVDGQIGGTLTVQSGGTLGGSGTVADVSVASGGTLAPGNSPGLLTVTGDLTLAPGSTTVMEINGTNRGADYDAIDVAGTATLDGTLDLVFGYVPTNGTQYRLIQAASIVPAGDAATGFASITSNLGAGLLATPVIDPATFDIVISLAQQDYLAVAGPLTRNQSAVAANLDSFSTSGQAAGLIAGLNTLAARALPAAFDTLSGVEHGFVPALAFQATRQFHGLLGQRLAGGVGQTAFNAFDGAKLAYAGNNLGSLADDTPAGDGFWLRALAADGRIDGDGNARGADTSSGGVAIGADRQVNGSLRIGAAFAYSRGEADTRSGDVDLDSYQLAAYGRWQGERFYLAGSAGYGRHEADARRNIAFLGARADSDYGADSFTLAVEAGRTHARAWGSFTPYLGLEAAVLQREGFTESGADDANLKVKRRTDDSLRSRLGVRYAWQGTRFAPSADVAWVHEFGDDRGRIAASFAGAPAAAFRIDGPELDRDRLALGLGLTAWAGKDARLDLAYRGEFAESDREHGVAATFRRVW
ncbi:autotransporter domain-containing protein [Pseudothauera rhizosphaerae]|nr:autotransporter domain-containing protein [Pseudothauera rhizosphaerae]